MIFCCGEALIDMIPESGTGELRFSPKAGGAIFNTAVGLGRLGVKTGFVSGISKDLFGKILLDGLQASNVNTDFVVHSDRPTTLAFVELVNGHASYTFYDENTAGRMLMAQDMPTLPDEAAALYFGGISLISEPAADFYLALAQRDAGKRVIMCDPNIRTGFIKDEAGYRARLETFLGLSDIVKVSDEDLNWMIPGDGSLQDKARTVQGKGASVVILTQGSAGATAFFNESDSVQVSVPKVQVVDTVGAGDTFNSGFLASLASNDLLSRAGLKKITGAQLEQALQMGAQVAAVTVSRKGANPPWASELPSR